MTKSRFSFLLAFGAVLTLASSADAQNFSNFGGAQPGAVATSVLDSASFGGTPVFGAAPVLGNAPVFNGAPAVGHAGCTSCGQSAGFSTGPQIAEPGFKSRVGCDLPGPTVEPGFPQLPIESCCGNTGRLNIPPLSTPIRYDTPPIGKSVGRPLFGRWAGY